MTRFCARIAIQPDWFHPLLGEQLIGTLAIARRMDSAESCPSWLRRPIVVNTFADFLAIQIANVHFQEDYPAPAARGP